MAIAVYIPSEPMSKPAPFQPSTPELLALVQRACAAYPDEGLRIRRGAEIVERDGVKFRADGVYEVGVYHRYPQVNGHCPCPDSALGHAPEGHCKHSWAKTFYRKLHAAPAPVVRTLHFYASLHGTIHGTAQVWEDGRIAFTEHDTTSAIPCTMEEIVLGGRKDLIDAARRSA